MTRTAPANALFLGAAVMRKAVKTENTGHLRRITRLADDLSRIDPAKLSDDRAETLAKLAELLLDDITVLPILHNEVLQTIAEQEAER